MNKTRPILTITFAVCGCLFAPVAQAGVFRDIVVGLGYAGFNVEGNHNVLSGGTDFNIGRNFVGNTLDFGAADLTLFGPISLEFSTGGRELSTFDVRLQTAIDGSSGAQPLAYAFNYDVGGQRTEVTGTILIDAEFSINGFGFYDLELDYSARQDVDREGRFSDSADEFDFDIGPVHIRGNLFADALALLTVPLFGADNPNNPFASFSGRTQLEKAIERAQQQALDDLATGRQPADVVVAGDVARAVFETVLGGSSLLGNGPVNEGAIEAARLSSVVPEPSVLVLMIVAIPAVVRRSRRRPTT